ncbi:MAG: hypothetical protein E7604_00095 [Ruminococcaceae bacterium]|nr:hypothetical protein [Oscillospiraceae bacterium]
MRDHAMKQSVLALVLLSMLAASAVSCGGSASGTTETGTAAKETETAPVTEAVTEDPALRDSLPEADLGGAPFRMTIFGTDLNRPQTYVDAQDGNIVNDAVYSKIRTVEERFNTDIVLTEMSYLEENHVSALKQAILAGDDSTDLAQGHDVNMANAAMEGLFINALDIPHLDFSKPWWPAATRESMTVAGQMYMMFNNIGYNNLAQTRVMYFNKNLMKELDFEFPYQMVYDGTWTLDAMNEMTAQAYRDLNGNGEIDNADQFGYVSMPYYYGIFEPFRVEPYRKDADGNLYYEVYLERTTQVVEKMYDMIFGEGGYLYPSKDSDYQDQVLNLFCEDRSLFFYGPMENAVKNFSSANDLSYGILPMPKLDASEDGYYGAAFDRPFVVPTTAEGNLDNIGLIIEALNAEGYKQVFPAYYEIAMKTRYADQTDDAKMIDIVHDNVIISFTYIHDNYTSVYGKMLWELFNASNPSKDVASWCAKNELSQTKRVEKLMQFFEKQKN